MNNHYVFTPEDFLGAIHLLLNNKSQKVSSIRSKFIQNEVKNGNKHFSSLKLSDVGLENHAKWAKFKF